jgi:hypothetical protein
MFCTTMPAKYFGFKVRDAAAREGTSDRAPPTPEHRPDLTWTNPGSSSPDSLQVDYLSPQGGRTIPWYNFAPKSVGSR